MSTAGAHLLLSCALLSGPFLFFEKPPAKPLSGRRFIFPAASFAFLERGEVALPKGTWELWIWKREGAQAAVVAGTDLYPAEKEARESTRFLWQKLGKVSLTGGGVSFRVEGKRDVAALCLSAGAFAPELFSLLWVRPFTPRALPDTRAATCRHLNQAFKPYTFPDRAAWEKRARYLRRHILASCGLWPLPRKTPLRAHIFGRIEREGYTVEKVFFESWPGLFVTGNLYRPRSGKEPYPAVLCPHGHWREGRFTDEGEPRGGVPPRAITLAKLGFVAFTYDMVGYGDSARQLRHSFAGEENELWGNSLMKLQLWNAIRGIDFLQSLPEVDPDRIGCTGASGGGTQTFLLMAVDTRVKVAAPVNMISAFMQGGCECENAPLLRIDTINCEIAALMAPRPLLMVSATGDWTSHTPQVEYPMVRAVYTLYGAADKVKNVHLQGPHNYNRSSREAMYRFFCKYLQGKVLAPSFREPPYTVETRRHLSVWAERGLPERALDRKSLEAYLKEEATARLRAFAPRNARKLAQFRQMIGELYRHVFPVKTRLDSDTLAAEFTTVQPVSLSPSLRAFAVGLLLRCGAQCVPAVLYVPASQKQGGGPRPHAALLVHPEGKAGFVDKATGKPGPYLQAFLRRNWYACAIDCFLKGEFHSPFGKTVRKKTGKFFTTYNRTSLVERVRDILLAERFLRESLAAETAVVGLGRAGRWVALALPFLPESISCCADLAGYVSGDTSQWLGEDFTPSVCAAGALRTSTALSPPRRLILFNVGAGFHSEWPLGAYQLGGAADMLTITAQHLEAEELAETLIEK